MKMGLQRKKSNRLKEFWLIKNREWLLKTISPIRNFEYASRFLYKEEYVIKNSELELFLDIVFFIAMNSKDKTLPESIGSFVDHTMEFSKLDQILLYHSFEFIELKLISLMIYLRKFDTSQKNFNDLMSKTKYLLMLIKKYQLSIEDNFMIKMLTFLFLDQKEIIELKSYNVLPLNRSSINIWYENNTTQDSFHFFSEQPKEY